jgi:SAM-dependent methyltransferase
MFSRHNRVSPQKTFSGTFYDETYFTNMAPVNRQMFRESCGRRLHPHRLYYVELMDLEPGMKVLDLGCGAGEVLMHCALERGIEGWGIDYSNAAIQLAEELKKLLPLDIQTRVQFHLGDCTELGIFPDGFFDRALSFSSIEHLYDWQIERMLAEVHRVLRDDGLFIIESHPNWNAERLAWPLARRLLHLLVGYELSCESEPEEGGHINIQSPKSLRNHLEQAGYVPRIILRPGTEFVRQRPIVRLIGQFLVRARPFNVWFANELAAVATKKAMAYR